MTEKSDISPTALLMILFNFHPYMAVMCHMGTPQGDGCPAGVSVGRCWHRSALVTRGVTTTSEHHPVSPHGH